jgi:hypothetical protein
MTPAQMELFYKAGLSTDAHTIDLMYYSIIKALSDEKGRNAITNLQEDMKKRITIDLLKQRTQLI